MNESEREGERELDKLVGKREKGAKLVFAGL